MIRQSCFTIALIVAATDPNLSYAQNTPEPLAEAFPDRRLLSWQPFIEEAAQRFNMPKTWISRVIIAESAGQATPNGQPITSRAGAMGLMQLMPATYSEMRSGHNLGDDPFDPHDNIMAGTAYLRAMFDRFGYPGLFAAYNAGPTRYEASLRGVPLPPETRAYVISVTEKQATPPIRPSLFVVLSAAEMQPKSNRPPTLFIPTTSEKSSENQTTPE